MYRVREMSRYLLLAESENQLRRCLAVHVATLQRPVEHVKIYIIKVIIITIIIIILIIMIIIFVYLIADIPHDLTLLTSTTQDGHTTAATQGSAIYRRVER